MQLLEEISDTDERMTPATPFALTLRLGCELTYYANRTTPALVLVRPAPISENRILAETYTHDPWQVAEEEFDSHGNRVDRVMLQPGYNVIRHDALVQVSSAFEEKFISQSAVPVERLPISILRYTLPSRYCDVDKLINFARERFDACAPGAETVQAIADWIHNNIEYRYGAGSSFTSAADVISQGYGVCRDFAHCMVALCRTFNIPARYVTSHLPDVAWLDNGTAMDFHANAEVYLDNRWITVDARFNKPRVGRMKVCCGMDAAETALSTLYGNVNLVNFQVWNYQVDPAHASLSEPVDLSKRLDGTPDLQVPPNACAY